VGIAPSSIHLVVGLCIYAVHDDSKTITGLGLPSFEDVTILRHPIAAMVLGLKSDMPRSHG